MQRFTRNARRYHLVTRGAYDCEHNITRSDLFKSCGRWIAKYICTKCDLEIEQTIYASTFVSPPVYRAKAPTKIPTASEPRYWAEEPDLTPERKK